MPRYKLRTLLIVLALGPFVLWVAFLSWDNLAHPSFFVPEFIDYGDGRGPQPIKPQSPQEFVGYVPFQILHAADGAGVPPMTLVHKFLIVVCAPVSLAAWLSANVFAYLAMANRKPEAKFDSPWLQGKPYNHIFVTAHLTPTGLKYRRWLVVSVLVFVLTILLVLVFGPVSGHFN